MSIEVSDQAAYPYQVVIDKYNKSVELANQAMSNTQAAMTAFNGSLYTAPKINVSWSTIPAPNLPTIPNMPTLPALSFAVPSGQPSGFSGSMANVAIDDINVQAPTLNFGTAPELVIGSAPAIPTPRDVALPNAPDIELPDVPQFLNLQTHNFAGVDLQGHWLDKLNDIPELSLLEPAPFEYKHGPRYASELLEGLKAVLNARIHSGTGIAPAVEQQIWERARDQELRLAQAREQEVMRSAESLGFALPSGVLAGQLADARREFHDKLSTLRREIAIKQAELEQENVKHAITTAVQLEGTLMQDYREYEQLVFEAAKVSAELAVTMHNAHIEQFKALLVGYQAYASAYDTVVKAQLAKVEVFKALLAAEETKASINKSLVERYKAEIEGRLAAVQVYKAQVGAAQTLVELERTRIQAGGEQVKAFVATVNAEVAKADLYKTRVGAETAKVEATGAMVRAYAAKVGAQAEKARVEVAKYQAQLAAKGLEWDGWKARLSAEVAKMEASAKASNILVDGYKVGATAAEAQAQSIMRRWEADIKQYEAGQNHSFQVSKANADALVHANDAKLRAAEIGLATSAQQVASAWSMVSASAQIDAGSRYSIGFNYSGDVSSDVSPQT